MEHIELSKFIENALVQIAQGITDANLQLRDPEKQRHSMFSLRRNIGDSAKIQGIKFDVAITTDKHQKDKAGFFVALANVGGGANTEKSKGNELFHRIQFEVGLNETCV